MTRNYALLYWARVGAHPGRPRRHLAFHLSSSSTRCYLPIRDSERRLYGRSKTSSCTSQETCRITQGFHHKITTFAAAHSGRSSTPLIYSETHFTLSITSQCHDLPCSGVLLLHQSPRPTAQALAYHNSWITDTLTAQAQHILRRP
jgi:hypothetical protein